MKYSFRYFIAFVALLGTMSSCKDGLLNTDMYDGHLPALNFGQSSMSIDETDQTPLVVAMSVYGGPTKQTGSIKVKIDASSEVVYGTDFTTQPAADDNGYITIDVASGQETAQFSVSVAKDTESISDKKVNFNLCNSQGDIQVGGKYNCTLTIVNKDATASWLTLNPSTNDLPDFGSIENGSVSEPQSFTLTCAGLRDGVTISAPLSFKLSQEQDGTFENSLYFEAADLQNTTKTLWVKFAPLTGFDGQKTGDIKIATTGTSGLNISVSGTEKGNSGPYYFVLPKGGDGFWNAKKSKIGNTVTLSLVPSSVGGDVYYSFDLSALRISGDKIVKVTLMQKASVSDNSVVSFFEINAWTQGTTVYPTRSNYITSLTSVAVNYKADEFVETDITQYVKSKLAAGTTQIYFGQMIESSNTVTLYGANSATDFTNNTRIVVYDK